MGSFSPSCAANAFDCRNQRTRNGNGDSKQWRNALCTYPTWPRSKPIMRELFKKPKLSIHVVCGPGGNWSCPNYPGHDDFVFDNRTEHTCATCSPANGDSLASVSEVVGDSEPVIHEVLAGPIRGSGDSGIPLLP